METVLIIVLIAVAFTLGVVLVSWGSSAAPKPTPPGPPPQPPGPSPPQPPGPGGSPTPASKCIVCTKCENQKECSDLGCDWDGSACSDIQKPPSCEGGAVNSPKTKAFETYLKAKLQKAINEAMTDSAYTIEATGSIAIYMKDTPLRTGPVRAWAAACGGRNKGMCNLPTTEPSFYFGSGTKPVTATLVASQIYKVWRKKNPSASPSEFIDWYAGKKNAMGLRGDSDAVTYQQLFELTSGFKDCQYTESLSRQSNTQAADSSAKTYIQRIQDWIFCCPTGGMIKECPASTSLFCNNSCDKICPIPLSTSFNQKCDKPLCPDDLCSWAWCKPNGKYDTATSTCSNGAINPKDPNTVEWGSYEWCSCPTVLPKDYTDILNNLSVYNVAMMRSGIPDSDSIWSIDNAAQLASRTHSIGPVEFVSEIIGFDWDPRWKNGKPVTSSAVLRKRVLYQDQNHPPAMYSSSAYSFLGILLWLLSNSRGPKDWSKIDLNMLLPRPLYCNLNFAGTEGRYNGKYFREDAYGNRYYSYEETVKQGGVLHSPQDDGMMGTKQTTLETVVNEQYTPRRVTQRVLRSTTTANLTAERTANATTKKVAPVYRHKKRGSGSVNFVDWDSSSGTLDGNSWGKCSGMAEIYMNIFSPTAENPLMPKEVQATYVNEFLRYEGANWESLWNNQLRSPYCLGGQAWSQGGTYNCGSMGPDWFYIYDNPNSYSRYGIIPCYGHLGDTYGSVSGHIYVPGGKLVAYPPMKNEYSNPKWSMTFKFCGGMEFTVSQAINAGDDQTTALQYFIAAVVDDPFDWSS